MKFKFNKFYVIIIILLIYVFLFSDVGYFSRKKLENDIKSLEQRVKQISNENKILKKEIMLLKNDPEYLAELARKLGYAKKGEKIFRFKMRTDESNR